MGANKLINTVPTRWYSTCAAINSVLKVKDALEHIPKERNYGYNRWGPIVEDSSFWTAIEGLKTYFDRLAAMIGRAESRVSLLSSSFRDLLEFIRFVSEIESQENYQEIALQAAVYHFNKLDIGLMLASYIVNPNYGVEYLTPKAIAQAKEYLVKTLFDINSCDEQAAETMMKEFTVYARAEGLLQPIEDPFNWWNRCRFPVLSSVARRLLALHSSSVNTERLFSALNSIATPRRNLISCSTMFDLISINLYEASLPSEREDAPLPPLNRASQLASGSQGRSEAGSQVAAELSIDEQPGTYLFDPEILEESGSPPLTSAFYSSLGYLEFRSLIDFSKSRPSLGSVGVDLDSTDTQEERRSSDELARRFMARYH